MKSRLNILLITLLLALSFNAVATPVGPMNYQGRLLDNNGIPVTDSYDFVVKIYDDPTAGTLKYQETHNGIAINDGVYSFKIGNGPKTAGTSQWDTDLWQGNLNDLYLEIVVNSETLTPRHELTSAPHAFTATLALALGNKTAEEYDNILEGVCIASKGKWLELANSGKGACLGAGASFPGPVTSVWYNFTASSDFTNLDLTGADISGIEFDGANLSGTTFKNTQYAMASINGANLSKTIWDGAVTSDSTPQNLWTHTNLSGAVLKNMDLSKWGFGWLGPYPAQYTGISAAYLTACPNTLFTSWSCPFMRGSSGKYFMAGPYGNFSFNSAVAKAVSGGYILDVDNTAFDNIQTSYATFNGVTLTQQFLNGSFYSSNLDFANLRNIRFSNTNFAGTSLKGAQLDDVTFAAGITMANTDFSNAVLNRVYFKNSPGNMNFSRASLRQVDFTAVAGVKFISAILEDVRFNGNIQSNPPPYDTIFDGTLIYGDLFIAAIYNQSDITMKDIAFMGGKVSGALTDLNFTGTITFNNVIFKNLDICSTAFPLVDTSAPHDDLATVKWEGPVECPDGTDVLGGTGTNTCNFTGTTRMTQTAVANCTAGIP